MANELVSLELPVEDTVMPVVRMVVGGMAARIDVSLDELDDLYLAVETVLTGVRKAHSDSRCSLRLSTTDDALRIQIGPYRRGELERLLDDPCCVLVRRVVSIEVAGDDEQAYVLIIKRGSAHRS